MTDFKNWKKLGITILSLVIIGTFCLAYAPDASAQRRSSRRTKNRVTPVEAKKDVKPVETTVVEEAEAEVVETPTIVEESEAAEVPEPAAEEAAEPVKKPELKMCANLEELDAALALPEGAEVEALFEFLEKIETLRPASTFFTDPQDKAQTDAEFKIFIARIMTASAEAAGRILKLESADDEQRENALSLKLRALLTLTQIDKAHESALYEFADDIRKGENPTQTWKVDGLLIQYEISKQTEAPSPETYKAHVGKLLAHAQKGIELGCLDTPFAATTLQMLAAAPQFLPQEETKALLLQGIELLKSSKDEQLLGVIPALEKVILQTEMNGAAFTAAFTTFDGAEIKTSDYAGKHLLLVFWNAMDEPSLKILPFIMQLNEFYHAKGLEVVGITTDPDSEELRNVLTKVEFPWPTVIDATQDAKPTELLGVVEIPTLVLIDPDGKILSTDIDFESLLKLIEQSYGNPAPLEEVAPPADAETPEDVETLVEELALPE